MKKKIAIYLGVLGNGGVESATVSQFKHFSKDRISVDFIIDSPNDCHSLYESVIKEQGGRIVAITEEDSGIVKKLVCFRKLLKREHYEVLHLNISYPSSLLYNVIAYLSGVKTRISTSHAQGTTIKSPFFLFYQKVCRLIYPLFCTHRIAVSTVAGKWLYGHWSFFVIPNAIDTHLFRFNEDTRILYRQKLALKTDLLIGHVGRFGLDKNHQMILRVFKEFNKNVPESKLLLIGDGPLHDEIEQLAVDMCISDSIIYIRNTNEVHGYMQAMDLLLMPSLREACSVVVMEAQASSLPVLASDTIPQENKISEIMYFESLNSTPARWALDISRILESNKKRELVNLSNGDFPCDINDLSKMIQNAFYL